eukprot:363142-Chlamydomonas_euryale.AAC.5
MPWLYAGVHTWPAARHFTRLYAHKIEHMQALPIQACDACAPHLVFLGRSTALPATGLDVHEKFFLAGPASPTSGSSTGEYE